MGDERQGRFAGTFLYRRQMLQTMGAAAILTLSGARVVHATNGETLTEEMLSGDPGAPAEPIIFNENKIAVLTAINKSQGVEKPKAGLAERMVSVAKTFVGYNKKGNAAEIGDFLKLFLDKPTDDKGNLLKYCAAGLSWAACRAYCDIPPKRDYAGHELATFKDTLSDLNNFYFRPHCSVNKMMEDAQRRKTWIDRKDARALKAGWFVIYDWDADGTPDHIGIVKALRNGELMTVEFNTSSGIVGSQSDGGRVAERHRSLNNVRGYIAWY